MTGRRWPILNLDEDATEAEIRRAYARCLRELGADADVAAFQALRTEFEAALAVARSGSNATRATDIAARPKASRTDDRQASEGDLPRLVPNQSRAVRDEIAKYLSEGDLVRACERFDRARSTDEIELAAIPEIESQLAEQWLANTTLDSATLANIVRRFHWDDVGSDFPLGTEIAEKLQAALAPVPKPGRRYVGQWNWGAFFLAPFWLMAHGLPKRGAGLLLLNVLALVFLPGLAVVLWIAVGYGRRGNALAIANRTFTSDEQFVAVQTAWRNWGFAFAVLTAAFVVSAFAWIVTLYRQ
jgi:hypothetical protein